MDCSGRKYIFQQDFESKFLEVARNNMANGVQLETIAFLIGIEKNAVYYSTELIFPNQTSSSDMVDDTGKKSTSFSHYIHFVLKSKQHNYSRNKWYTYNSVDSDRISYI